MSVTKIAFCGKLRSGKSTAASYLERKYGFAPVSFGSPIAKYSAKLFAFSSVYKSEPIKKDDQFGGAVTIGSQKPRKLRQDFGQKLRELDPNIWIDHAAKKIRLIELEAAASGEQARIVIDDLRQPNEEAWARANGFIFVRVNANADTRIARAKEAGDDFDIEDLRHGTELHVDDIEADYDIWNDGEDRAELERKIDEIMETIRS